MCVREKERERERMRCERVRVRVRVRERERERERGCVVCVCERERERERICVCSRECMVCMKAFVYVHVYVYTYIKHTYIHTYHLQYMSRSSPERKQASEELIERLYASLLDMLEAFPEVIGGVMMSSDSKLYLERRAESDERAATVSTGCNRQCWV